MNSEFSLLRKTSDKYSVVGTPNGSLSTPSPLSSLSDTPASTLSLSSSTTTSTTPSKHKQTPKKVCESFEMNDFRHLIKIDNNTQTIEPPTKTIMVVSSIIDNPPTNNATTTTTTDDMKSLNERVNESLFIDDQHQNDIDPSSDTIDNGDHQQKQDEESSEKLSNTPIVSDEHNDTVHSDNNAELQCQHGTVNTSADNDYNSVIQSDSNEASSTTSASQSPPVALNVKVPFPLLPGECLVASESVLEGTLFLTNYRIYIEKPKNKNEQEEMRCYQQTQDEQLVNLPIGAIDSVEIRDILCLLIYTKYVQSITMTFNNAECAANWQKRFSEANLLKVENQFCFKFYEHFRDVEEYSSIELINRDEQKKLNNQRQLLVNEFDRMGFDSKNWRICELNKDYKFSHSYPQYFVVPNDTTDKELDCVANFRYSRRVPAVVWRSQRNGCVIARSSQPVVGWLGWRSSQDERLLQKVVNICNKDVSHFAKARRKHRKSKEFESNFEVQNGSVKSTESSTDNGEQNNGHVTNGNGHIQSNGNVSTSPEDSRFLILDARSYTAALANRAMGGGCECAEYYTNCEVQFMGLANIHTVRKSFYSLRYICEASQIDQPNWFTLLDNTKWFHNLSALLKCALVIVDSITIQERPVLVHCSDGWDRTPQVVAMAELMLDPFYRTIEGFKVLIQREWLDFGHKFADRCRSSTLNVELNERCPVFLQWLDCVHQLLRQYPAEFEFNEHLLVKLVHHTYSGLFGTFTCNNVQERVNEQVYDKTVSFWAYVENEKEKFINYLYLPKQEVLRVSSRVKDLLFWNEIYVPVQSTGLSNIPYNDISTTENGNTATTDDDCDDVEANIENHRNLFITRSAEFATTEGVSTGLNEADIDESKIDLQCQTSMTNCLSQSKSDLTRAASFESLNKIKFDSPNNQVKKSAPSAPSDFEPECRLRVKHLSDTCLYDPNEISNDRDRFLSPSRDDLNEERPLSEKISDDSSCDDNASTKNERRSLDERFCDGGVSPKPNPAELFDIDGEFVVKDKSNTQIQQMIIYHKRMIHSLSQQLQNSRTSNASSRAHKVYSPEERSRRSYAYKQNQELLENICNLNASMNNGSQFKSNGFY